MSGPYFTVSDVGCIGGHAIHFTGIPINGLVGGGVMYIDTPADSLVFELLIAGRLSVKEKVCGLERTRAERSPRPAKYRAVCSKVKP